MRLHFQAVSQFGPEDLQTVLNVIDGPMLKHQAQTWGLPRQVMADTPAKKRPATKAARKRPATR